MLPASPVRPPSPPRPAGPGRPGRPGRTIRTVGPPRHGYDALRPSGERRFARRGRSAADRAERAGHAGRTSFVMLVAGLLACGLVCLLVVNTTLAANSIQMNQLEQANAAKAQQIQQLRQETAAARSAAVIATEARKLGMRPQRAPVFVDLRHRALRVGKEPMR